MRYIYPKSPPIPPDGYNLVEVSHITESSGPNPDWDFEREVRLFSQKRHASLEAIAEPTAPEWDGNPLDVMLSWWDRVQGKWSDWEHL